METHIDLRLNISPLFLWKNFEAQNGKKKEIHAYIYLYHFVESIHQE